MPSCPRSASPTASVASVPRAATACSADARHDHPALPGDANPAVRGVSPARLDRHLAAVDRAPLLLECVQRVPAAPVLPDDPAGPR